MSTNSATRQDRAVARRRVGKARAALVGTALLGSLGVAAGMTAQAVAATQAAGSAGTPGRSAENRSQASRLVGPSHGHRSHARTQGS